MVDKMNIKSEQDTIGEPGPDDQQVNQLETAGGGEAEAPKNIQQQVEEHEAKEPKKFGTFGGVFTPTLLTILGETCNGRVAPAT